MTACICLILNLCLQQVDLEALLRVLHRLLHYYHQFWLLKWSDSDELRCKNMASFLRGQRVPIFFLSLELFLASVEGK